ncbi:MAG: hypothetical protein ABIR35_11025, partial [Polaromonas sp.]
SLFFASPKKSKQKKGDPGVCVPALRYGQPAVLASGGVRANSLHCVALRQCAALIRLKLRSSAHTQGLGADSRTAEYRNTQVHEDTPWRVLVCIGFCLLSWFPFPTLPFWPGL